MKKFATIAVIALVGAIVLPSCKKDYVCTCNVGGTEVKYDIKNVKKSDAKAACTVYQVSGISCSLD